VTEASDLATAHREWDKRWNVADDQQPDRWREPDPLVMSVVPALRERGTTRALDLGCGLGRHAHLLASEGFSPVVGLDGSDAGLAYARRHAEVAGLSIDYRQGAFYEIPFADSSFDLVVGWNVIYHGDGDVVRRTLDEIRRVLAQGGLYVATMLSKRNTRFGKGREVRPDTFVVDDALGDEVHPHFYCESRRLLQLHHGFEVLELRDREQGGRGAWHWEFILERQAAG